MNAKMCYREQMLLYRVLVYSAIGEKCSSAIPLKHYFPSWNIGRSGIPPQNVRNEL